MRNGNGFFLFLLLNLPWIFVLEISVSVSFVFIKLVFIIFRCNKEIGIFYFFEKLKFSLWLYSFFSFSRRSRNLINF